MATIRFPYPRSLCSILGTVVRVCLCGVNFHSQAIIYQLESKLRATLIGVDWMPGPVVNISNIWAMFSFKGRLENNNCTISREIDWPSSLQFYWSTWLWREICGLTEKYSGQGFLCPKRPELEESTLIRLLLSGMFNWPLAWELPWAIKRVIMHNFIGGTCAWVFLTLRGWLWDWDLHIIIM